MSLAYSYGLFWPYSKAFCEKRRSKLGFIIVRNDEENVVVWIRKSFFSKIAPQETNQLDERVNHQLLAILKDMVVNIVRPDNHYMVSASYIEFLDEQRTYRRQYLCPIYVHQDAAWSIDFDEEGILLDVVMAPGPNIPRERIRIPYATI